MSKYVQSNIMTFTKQQKKDLEKELVACLCKEKEIIKIVVFGSFVQSQNPNDLDVAVFQESEEGYLPLALKYRKKTRPIARKIPIDIFPVKAERSNSPFLFEISQGITIYER